MTATTPAPVPEAQRQQQRRRSPWVTLVVVVLPLLVMGAITLAVASNGDRILQGFGHNPPPADELLVERVEFHPGRVEIDVANPQSQPITPAYVTVDAAIVNSFEVEGGGREIGAREHRTLSFDYPWIEDDPYLMSIVSSSGIPTDIEVPAAVRAQDVDQGGIGWGALVGVLVGFVPVALGLVWLPALRQLSQAALAGFLAFTAGMLGFLAIDATVEAIDTQARLIPAVGGVGVVATGIAVSYVALSLIGYGLRRGAGAAAARRNGGSTALSGATLALLVAIGIGLHNLGEGLAIGSSFATGEASLAIALVIGFMVHNLTEGVGIAAPLARDGRRLGVLRGVGLAALAGLPAVVGIWAGRYVAGPLFTTLCFAIAAGAALQVIVEIGKALRARPGDGGAGAGAGAGETDGRSTGAGSGRTGLGAPHVQLGFAAGLLVMWATGILAG